MKIGIIGTAGRGDTGSKLNKPLFTKMVNRVQVILNKHKFINPYDTITLVSGGAAWADHVAVQLFLDSSDINLELHLPTEWNGNGFLVGSGNKYRDTGHIANYYHGFMSAKGIDSIKQLDKAINSDNCFTKTYNGFKQRNLIVGKVDMLIAFTFGIGNTPADGGTSHTWNNSNSPDKLHISLNDI